MKTNLTLEEIKENAAFAANIKSLSSEQSRELFFNAASANAVLDAGNYLEFLEFFA